MPLINVPPVLSLALGNSTFTVGGASAYVNPTITVTDVSSPTLASASVSLLTGFLTGDQLAVAASALAGTNITASYNATTGNMSLTGVDTLAHYQSVLRAVTYTSTAANPLGLNLDVLRVASFTVNDGTLSSLPSLANVSILPDPISVSSNGQAATFVAGTVGAVVAPTLTLADSASPTIASATVAIGAGFLPGDVLSVASSVLQGTNIAANYNAVTGTLALTGVDTVADYNAVLDAVNFSSTALDPTLGGTHLSRVATVSVNDGTVTSTPIPLTISLAAAATPSVSTSGSGGAYVTNEGPAVVNAGVTLSEAGGSSVQSATVMIASGLQAGDLLAATTTGTNITASYNALNGTLTLAGADSAADYQQVLRSVTFASTAGDPTAGGTDPSRTIAISASAGLASSTPVNTTVSVALAAAPIISAAGAGGDYHINGSPVLVNSGVSITEPGTLRSATVAVGTGFQAGDVLAAMTTGTNITAAYNAGTGVLSLTGVDTAADYQQVLRSVTYTSTAADASLGGTDNSRTIAISASAGPQSNSTVFNTTVTIDPAPTATPFVTASSMGGSYHSNEGPAVVNNTVAVSESGGSSLQSASVVIASGLQAGDVLAATTDGTSINASYNANTGTLTLTGTDTAADYQRVLRSVTYTSTSSDAGAGGTDNTRTITFSASAGPSNTSTPVGTTISVDQAPMCPPTAPPIDMVPSYNYAGTAGTSGTGALHGASDPDGGTLSITQVNGSAANVGISTQGTYGHLTLNADGSEGYLDDMGLSIVSAADGAPINDVFSYVVTDSNGSSTATTNTFTVALVAGGIENVAGLSDATVSARVLNLGGTRMNVTQGAAGTYSGVIQDGSSGNVGGILSVAGTAALTLTGANIYTGRTSVGGTLQLGTGGSIATSQALKMLSGGIFDISGDTGGASVIKVKGPGGTIELGSQTLTLSGSTMGEFDGTITDGGASGGTHGVLKVLGTGGLTLGGVNTYTGKTSVGATLQLATGASIATSQALKMLAGGVFDISGDTGGASVIKVKGPGGTIMLGSQTLTLSGSNMGEFDGTITDGGIAGGTGGVLKVLGTGGLTLGGVNTYTGKTSVGATLQLVTGASIASSQALKMLAGGVFDISGDTGGASVIKVKGPGGTIMLGSQTLTLSGSNMGEFDGTITDGGVAGGTGGVLKVLGTGGLTLTGVNSYTGKTSVGATLALGAGGSIAASQAVKMLAGGVFDISADTGGATISKLKGPGGTVALGGQTLTITSTTAGEFDGTITDGGIAGGSGGVVNVAGPATLLLSGASTYTGGTIVSSGSTLELSGASAAGSGNITFNGAGTVKLDAPALTALSSTQSTFANTIAGMGANDALDLSSLAFSSGSSTATINNGVLTATSGGNSVTLNLAGVANGTQFTAAADAMGGTLITQTPATPGAFVYTPAASPSSSQAAAPSGDLAPSPATMLAEAMNTPSSSASSTYTAPAPSSTPSLATPAHA